MTTETCPGCDRKTAMAGVLGVWHDPCGRTYAYLLCPTCAAVVRGGSHAERDALARRVEFSLEYPHPRGNG